ncbi:RDD family protein [Nocardia vaccinii]|uniref:RDD family protein n=1 Tax=Nocardia vaccinii TaxID=1822 RepID=UPI000833D6F1|nr:RDD family protein [Nocardia vaccinii]
MVNQSVGAADSADPPRAIDWPATRAALGYRRLWLWLGVLVSAACGPLAVVAVNKFDRPGVHGAAKAGRFLAGPLFLIFVFGLMFALTFLWIHRRRRRALQRNPWIRWQINYISTGRYEWVELLDANRRPISALILSTWANGIGKLVNHRTTEVWFAGDPHKYGVISVHEGGGPLRYAYYSPARRPPTFTYRDPGVDRPRSSDGPGAGEYEMQRENGRVMMKRPGDPEAEAKPKRHGALDDPDYPSPRKLRRALGFALDVLIHLAIGGAVAFTKAPHPAKEALLHRDWQKAVPIAVFMVLGFLAASFVNRVIIQTIVHTTLGKAVFGLVALRPDTGRYPSFGRLLAIWLMDLYVPPAFVAALCSPAGDLPGPARIEDYILTAVQWRDRR